MNGDGGSNYSEANRRDYEPRRFKSLIAQLHREAQQRRSSTKSKRPEQTTLVGVTRWLVIWTAALVFVGICSLGAALLQ